MLCRLSQRRVACAWAAESSQPVRPLAFSTLEAYHCAGIAQCAEGISRRMPRLRNIVDPTKFNDSAVVPFELRLKDFELTMQDVYDFFYDVNAGLEERGLERLDDMLRPAIMSGVVSDM